MGRRDRKAIGGKASSGRGVAADTSAAALAETKVCPVCRLPFTNRKKWAARGLWPSVVYCSERCRRGGTGSGGRTR